jgi:excisionase family DNA binding protein
MLFETKQGGKDMNMKELKEKEVLTVGEARTITGLSKRTIYNLVKSGKIPANKPSGKLIFIEKQALINWMLGR